MRETKLKIEIENKFMKIEFNGKNILIGNNVRVDCCMAYGATPAFDCESQSYYNDDIKLTPKNKKLIRKIIDEETSDLNKKRKIKISGNRIVTVEIISDNCYDISGSAYYNASASVNNDKDVQNFTKKDLDLIATALDNLDGDIQYAISNINSELEQLAAKEQE